LSILDRIFLNLFLFLHPFLTNQSRVSSCAYFILDPSLLELRTSFKG
jgi:hypothetical protein